MQHKKELCRNFQRGHCRYGETCRYLHANQQQPKSNVSGFGIQTGSNQQQKQNPFGFGTQSDSNQQQKQNPFGFGTQTGSNQQQKANPFGFGGENNSQSKGVTGFGSKQNQVKPFQNTWNRSSSTSTGGASRQSDNQTQAGNHKCTDPETCRRQIAEDFEQERPLWKLTCYSHSKQACDIVGDISYEELRAAAYDDARRGLSMQSIVERERNLLNSKLVEYDNLLHKPNTVPPNSGLSSQGPFPGAGSNAFSQAAQNGSTPSVSSFSQLGASPNVGFGIRPSTPSNNAFGQLNAIPNSSQTSGSLGTNNFPHGGQGSFGNQFPTQTLGGSFTSNVAGFSNSGSSFTSNVAGFNNSGTTNAGSNPFSLPAAPAQISSSTINQLPILPNGPNFNAGGPARTDVQLVNNLQTQNVSGDTSIWLKEQWNPGEIPEEAPQDAFV